MKKIIMSTVFACCIYAGYGQKLPSSKVPANVRSAFENKYPGLMGSWEKEKDNYEVNFKHKGSDLSMIIDKSGNIIETEMDIKTSELMAEILTYIKLHYKDKPLKEAAKITKPDGTVTYEAEVGDMDVLFDSTGKFIKETRKEKDDKEEKD